MEFEIIQTERLYLRKLHGDQWEEILKSSSDLEVMAILGVARDDLPKERAKAERGFSSFNKSLLIFQLMEKASGQMIGWCGYHTWYHDHNRAEIGYGLYDDSTKRKGYMAEAMTVIIQYGFGPMRLQRIEAFVGAENEASLRILAKFGFSAEGRLRAHYFTNNRYEDSLMFSLLADEWKPITEAM